MGRHPKPKLTPREIEAIQGKGYRIAAAIISDLRGANAVSISPFEARRRKVSARWLADELRGKDPAGKTKSAPEATPRGEIIGDGTIRGPQSPVHKPGDIPERASEPANQPFTPKVGSEGQMCAECKRHRDEDIHKGVCVFVAEQSGATQ